MTSKMINKYVAFFDAEYTAVTQQNKGIQEVIQVAFLIFDASFDEDGKIVKINSKVDEYVTFVKAVYNKQLSSFIKELTGIQQENVDSGISVIELFDTLISLIKKYNIDKVIVWGPDKLILQNNISLTKYKSKKANYFLNRICDISNVVSNQLHSTFVLSQQRACFELEVKEEGSKHNAYYDALNLSKLVNKLDELKI